MKRLGIISIALISLSTLILAFLYYPSARSLESDVGVERDPIELEYPEVYELANIILALTDYGIEDPWEVQKNSDYYDAMREWFDPFRDHPIIQSANYSREQWEHYLSFRTDAYAFIFNEDGRLIRTSDFNSFSVAAFDEQLEAIEDFARQTNFREFFASNRLFHEQMVEGYRQAYMLEEMRDFLEAEFGAVFENRRYVIALSPFVYAQNLHRNIDATLTVDFPSVARPIVQNEPMSREEQASAIHTLFTEMSHGYVNPTTDQNADTVLGNFDPMIWAGESGYEESRNAVFNEYMTWAAYDIFVAQVFPEYAEQVRFNWHIQNESRGFLYSRLFAQQVIEIYSRRQPGETIRELYPALIDRLADLQSDLSKPIIANSSEVYTTEADVPGWIEIVFSEPMIANASISYAIKHAGHEDVTGILSSEDIRWSHDQQSVQLRVAFEKSTTDNYGIMLNTFGSSEPLISARGVALKAHSYRLVQAH